MRHKRPVYIEIPRDVVGQSCEAPGPLERIPRGSDPAALGEAIGEANAMIRAARRPVILAGVEIHRFGLQEALVNLVDSSRLPFATTLLGKSVIGERHPGYLGVYEGAMGLEKVRRAVETADCVLILGAFMTDINLGIYTAQLEPAKTINATSERISISHHHFDEIDLREFIVGLTDRLADSRRNHVTVQHQEPRAFRPHPNRPITVNRFFARMNEFLDEHKVVICDIGDSLFGAADLQIHRRTEFLSPAYYTSMGFAVPAAIGAQINRRTHRPVVFVGDGAFQMTGHELSTIAKLGLNPIVFVLNNKGYTTERFISEGPYNDIQDWAFHEWPRIVRAGWGCEVRTEGELEAALREAESNTDSYSIVNVHLEKLDRSRALDRLARRLAKRAGRPK
ncbi:MAG TPA: thiamine pyrophosphate-dependent enzyme, partial [Gammaproteobacteria bacterium]|nr:thiamine pyrophosphate-dependent enzyme [Gammaproteobacteria bacterium]